jgi:hypothetical protein
VSITGVGHADVALGEYGVYIERLDLGCPAEPSFDNVFRNPLVQLYAFGTFDDPMLLIVMRWTGRDMFRQITC